MLNGSKIIALCITKITDTLSQSMVAALNSALAPLGHNLFVYTAGSDLFWGSAQEKGEASVYSLINYEITDVIIIFEERIKNEDVINKIISSAKNHQKPVIIIGNGFDGCINIKFDYAEGFKSVIRHVIDFHKISSMHIIAGTQGNEFSDDRIRAFEQVLAEHNLPFDESMVSYGDFWSTPASKAAQRLIDQKRVPEAVICANDTMALAVADVFTSNGFDIPNDVIVTGFDGIPEINCSAPKITSAFCDCTDIAKAIVDILPQCFDNTIASDYSALIVPKLIPSESCGCCPSEYTSVSQLFSDLNNLFFLYRESERSLAKISARIQTSATITEAALHMKNRTLFFDMCVILRKSCIDMSVDPLSEISAISSEKELFLFYNSDDEGDFSPVSFAAEDIIPGLDYLMCRQIPIIFSALNFLNIPLGYVCFHFNNYEMKNYCKIAQTVNALNNAIGGFRNMRYQRYLAGQIEQMYKFDALTNLYNRSGFVKEYAIMSKRIKKQGGNLTIVLADLDGLKSINDIYGHGEGDAAIAAVAQALKLSCPEGSICARFGGDEMMAVYDCPCSTQKITDGIYQYLADYTAKSGKPYITSASVGIYVTDEYDNLDFEELLKKADKLMYIDKMRKKNK